VTAILAEGLTQRPAGKRSILYAAENHNHAAEILQGELVKIVPAGGAENFQILNTGRRRCPA